MGDKRIHERIPTKFLVNCSKTSKDTLLKVRFLAYSKDISDKGIHLVVSKDLQKGDRFNMSLELPDFFLPITTSGEVVWNQESSELNGVSKENVVFEIGVRFNRIDLRDKEKLRTFIEKRSLQQTLV